MSRLTRTATSRSATVISIADRYAKRMSRQKISPVQTLVASSLRGALKLGLGPQVLGLMSRSMNAPKLKRKAFADYTPNEHDVVVCTYAKSGTNWMLQIVTQVAHLGKGEFEHIHDLVPWPDPPMPGIVDLKEPTWESAPIKLRAVKTHWEAPFVPYNPDARYIVVVRDPKDVLVSSYHFADSIFSGVRKHVPPEVWAELFVAGRSPFGSWPAHTASFWPWRKRGNVHFIRFEEMKADLKGTVRRVAEFMGVALTDEQLSEVVRKSRYSYMKAIDHKFAPPSATPGRERAVMLRSGETGQAEAFLSAPRRQGVDRAMRRELERLGSDFPYTQFYAREVEPERAVST